MQFAMLGNKLPKIKKQEEFEDNDSELETVARDSIGETIEYILQWFDIYVEDAIG